MRVGPRMRQAANYVAGHPGCAILPVARYIAPGPQHAPNPGIGYGYAAVHRAIDAGLIVARQGRGNRYALYSPEDAPKGGKP